MRDREAVAAGFVRFGHIRTEYNAADALTKPLGPLAFHHTLHPYLFRHLKHHQCDEVCDQPQPFRSQYKKNTIKTSSSNAS